MPQRTARTSPPPSVMTWKKAMPVLLIAGIFDLLRLFFEFLAVTAPVVGAALCSYFVSSENAVATFIGNASCAVLATAGGIAAAPVLETFGIVMGMAIGLMGWLAVGLILLTKNRRIFAENLVWFMGALVVSEIPIVGSVPAITLILWKMYRNQIKTEQAASKAYAVATAAMEARQAQEAARRALLEVEARQAEEEAAEEEMSAAELQPA